MLGAAVRETFAGVGRACGVPIVMFFMLQVGGHFWA